MADDNLGDQAQRPSRELKDMKGLLKFCMENTKAEDVPSAHREMSPERKRWLSEALNGMQVDPVQEVREHIRTVGVFLGSGNPSDQQKHNALNSLHQLFDWCENLDIAMDFLKIGGFSILHELVTHTDSAIRLEGFRLVGVLVQNHPACQEQALSSELLQTMLNVLSTEHDPEIQCQALQAISCLVRDSSVEGAQQQFLAHDGLGVLRRVLQCPGGVFKRVVKIAFFLDALTRQDPKYKDAVCEAGLVELLAQEIQGEHQQSHECLMSALLQLASGHPPTQSLLNTPHLGMIGFFQNRIQLLAGREENEEERAYAEELLQILQTASSSSSSPRLGQGSAT